MTDDDRDEMINEAAQAWLVKMRGEDADGLRSAFEEWYNTAPQHRAAYHRMENMLSQSSVLKTSARYGRQHAGNRGRQRQVVRRWLTAGAMAAAAAMLFMAISAGGASLSGSHSPGPMAAWAAEPLVTKHGEIRSFRLADGSVATLDTDSRIDVRMTVDARTVTLAKGRARLQIAGDRRPFQIQAGAGLITAGQGSIDIARDDNGRIALTLTDGSARIGTVSARADQPSSLPLPEGRPVVFPTDDAALTLLEHTGPDSQTDWPTGWAEYRTVRLDRLVAEANRYASAPIIIEDPAIARLEASGRFRISQTETFIRRLSQLFDLAVERKADGIYLRTR
jgi:transmembrane sensor